MFNAFDLILANHPTVQAYFLEKTKEGNDQGLGFCQGVLFEGIGDEMLELQSGVSGFRLLVNADEFEGLEIRIEKGGLKVVKIDDEFYQIETAERNISTESRHITFNLLKNA